MKQQSIQSEEKHIGYNAWFSVFIGVVLLIQALYPYVEQYKVAATVIAIAAFSISLLMFFLKGGFNRKLFPYLEYKDEFFNQINHIAMKHTVIGMSVTLVITIVFGSDISLLHQDMAICNLAVMSLLYGFSLIWQNRD